MYLRPDRRAIGQPNSRDTLQLPPAATSVCFLQAGELPNFPPRRDRLYFGDRPDNLNQSFAGASGHGSSDSHSPARDAIRYLLVALDQPAPTTLSVDTTGLR